MNFFFRLVICCILATLVFVNSIPNSFADGFESVFFKWSYKPTMCVFEPFDPKFPGLGQKMFIETQDAVLDWQTKLNGGNANGPWNIDLIDIPYPKTNSYDSSNCDIAVNFKPSPDNPNEKFNEAGVTVYKDFPKISVTIYYLGVNLREQYLTFWQNGTLYYTYQPIPYFTGYLASDPQLEMTIRHELGHSLGLGHYIVSDTELARIVQGYQDMPSIMVTTIFTYGVTHFDITPLDIKEVQSIYGLKGLPAKSLHHDMYNISQNNIQGTVTTGPTAHQTQGVAFVKSQVPPWIKNIAKWWSQNKVSDDEFEGAMGYLVKQGILKVPTTQSSIPSDQIPTWIQANAEYWADGKISDYEFIRGIQYLISMGIIKL